MNAPTQQKILAICLLIVLFYFPIHQLMADRRIRIKSDPSGVSVTLKNKRNGQTLQIVQTPRTTDQLEPGEYELIFGGYRATEIEQPGANVTLVDGLITVKIEDNGLDQPVDVKLERLPLPGTLTVLTDPRGARVTLDGKSIGRTPIIDRQVHVGTYHLRLFKPNYQPIEEDITITDGESTTIKRELPPVPAKLTIRTVPDKANVFLNEQLIGKTELTQELPPGSYTVRLILAGYQEEKRTFILKAGDTRNEPPIPLKPNPTPIGTLTVYTTPTDAEVSLDGNSIGQTPIIDLPVPAGTHRLRLFKNNYQPIEEDMTIADGKLTPMNRTLPGIATLIVRSHPSNAKVYLDSQLVGRTPQTKTLVEGSHKIRVVPPWWRKPYDETRSFAPGEAVTINTPLDLIIDPLFILFVMICVGIVILARMLIVLLRQRAIDPRNKYLDKIKSIVRLPKSLQLWKSRIGGDRNNPKRLPNTIRTTFGEYELLEKIGKPGGMAMVYKAQHQQRPGVVALKIPYDNMLQGELVQRFLRQAEISTQLSHPHIVRVVDSGEVNGKPYLAMEYVQGVDLRERMNQQGLLPVVQTVKYIVQVCEALDYVHLKQIYHRDIKPENILITTDDQVKVIDFGIALAKQMPKISVDGIRWLSGGYLCPDREVGPTSDLYTLGAVFYEMLTGHLPFESGDLMQLIRMHEHEPPLPPRQWRPDIPEGLEVVVLKMLAKNPTERYPQAVAVIQALRPYLLRNEQATFSTMLTGKLVK